MNNKIIIIGIIFILLFTINFSLNNSHASLNALYQVPIILVNNENVSTPNPFQQMIQLNELNYKGYIIYNGSFANFEFVYNNGTVIPAWIESNNSGKLIIWLKINSILALSSETIYLDIFPRNDNLLNASGKNGIGEAPQLSPTYGEYDNGASVFNFYDNFAGTSLNTSKWTAYYNGYITVNNGITFGSGGLCFIETNTKYSISNILEMYVNSGIGTDSGIMYVVDVNGNQYTNANYGQWISVGLTTGEAYNGLEADARTQYAITQFSSGVSSAVSYTYPNAPLIMGVVVPNLTNGYLYVNDEPVATDTQNVPPQGNYYISLGGYQSNLNVYYVRVRTYPPNGVMPKVIFGSLSSITRISKSEEMNIHTRIYALNLSLPQEWGIYGFLNYSIYGKNYSISISNLTNNYYLNLSINYSFSIFNNTTLSYNLSLFAYKLQDYIAINHLNYKGRLNVTTTQKEYNITLNDSIIKFENVNNFYYFWNQYGYKVIGSILIIGLFLFFISRLRRMR